jgi:nicotinate-nucleotide pyrophosphorylase (carboxylating)
VRLAVREDLGRGYDWTTLAVVPQGAQGKARIVARYPGVLAGVRAARCALAEMETQIEWRSLLNDGAAVAAGTPIAEMAGAARDLLTAERLVLNLMGRLSGIATLTRQYVDAIAGTGARIYDTRKTTPGWRRLEKYAVRCGGGTNHRAGLYDAVLIKDNHLAFTAGQHSGGPYSVAEAVVAVRAFLADMAANYPELGTLLVEIEVDTLAQLEEVLPAGPDIVLLDNMAPDQLRVAVARRNSVNRQVELEASGGVSLATVRAVAESGVERISVGALTHAAVSLDVGLDWL